MSPSALQIGWWALLVTLWADTPHWGAGVAGPGYGLVCPPGQLRPGFRTNPVGERGQRYPNTALADGGFAAQLNQTINNHFTQHLLGASA